MRVLIACEESQEVCKAFRALKHEAYSCDIQEPSGGHPEWHIFGDALMALRGGQIVTMDGVTHDIGKWDLLIAHPPCTYLSNAGGKASLERSSTPRRARDKRHPRPRSFYEVLVGRYPKDLRRESGAKQSVLPAAIYPDRATI